MRFDTEKAIELANKLEEDALWGTQRALYGTSGGGATGNIATPLKMLELAHRLRRVAERTKTDA